MLNIWGQPAIAKVRHRKGPPSQRSAIAKARHRKGPPSQRSAIAKVLRVMVRVRDRLAFFMGRLGSGTASWSFRVQQGYYQLWLLNLGSPFAGLPRIFAIAALCDGGAKPNIWNTDRERVGKFIL